MAERAIEMVFVCEADERQTIVEFKKEVGGAFSGIASPDAD